MALKLTMMTIIFVLVCCCSIFFALARCYSRLGGVLCTLGANHTGLAPRVVTMVGTQKLELTFHKRKSALESCHCDNMVLRCVSVCVCAPHATWLGRVLTF